MGDAGAEAPVSRWCPGACRLLSPHAGARPRGGGGSSSCRDRRGRRACIPCWPLCMSSGECWPGTDFCPHKGGLESLPSAGTSPEWPCARGPLPASASGTAF